MYSTTVTVTINGSTATLSAALVMQPMQGDALLVNHEWCEVSSVSGTVLTLFSAYSGGSYTGQAILLQCASSYASPALRLRAEYEFNKLEQKFGTELIDFLTTTQSTVDVHGYTQPEPVVKTVASAAAIISQLPAISTTPAPNTIPCAGSGGTIDIDWFNTPNLPIRDAGSSTTSAAVGPIPSASLKVQAATGSNVVALTPSLDRQSVVVVSNQDSLCLELKVPTKPTAESMLRNTEFTVLLLPKTRLTSLTFKDNAVELDGRANSILYNRSGGKWDKYNVWVMRFVFVEGGFKQQSGGWSLAMARGPFNLSLAPSSAGNLFTLDGATAVFPVDPAIDLDEVVNVDTYFPSGHRTAIVDIVGATPDKMYITPFLWGIDKWSPVDKSQGRLEPLLNSVPGTLTQGNSRATGSGAVYNKTPKTYGKWYYEVVLQDTLAYFTGFGLNCGHYLFEGVYVGLLDSGSQPNFSYWGESGTRLPINYIGVGDVFGIAYDVDGATVSLYQNGVQVWTHSGAPRNCAPIVLTSSGRSLTALFHASDFLYPPPPGFSPWAESSEDPATKSARERISVLSAGSPLVLSEGNRVVSAPSVGTSFCTARSDLYRWNMPGSNNDLGRWYWEVHIDQPQSLSDVVFGMAHSFNADGSIAPTSRLLLRIDSALAQTGTNMSGDFPLNLTIAVGDVFGILYDLPASRTYIYHNGVSVVTDIQCSGVQYPVVQLRNQAVIKCVFHLEDFKQPLPSGYLPWSC